MSSRIGNSTVFNSVISYFRSIISYMSSMTITDIKLMNNLIYCSYNLSIALRIHHAPIKDIFELPENIIQSFAFKYFSKPERDFIFTCQEYNSTLEFRQQNPSYKISRITTGKEIAVSIYNPNDFNNSRKFVITDLSKFVGLCRRYKNPSEVEKIIISIFQ